MKRQFYLLFVVGLIVLLIVSIRAGEKKKSDPAAIYGRIQFVQSFPDYKVKAVTSFPDVKVKIVKKHPGPGEWQIVDSSPDFKIKLVSEFPDFTVEFEGGVPEEAKSAD